MYCITTHAIPDPKQKIAEEAKGSGGAYVLSWIDFPDVEGAKVLSDHYIRDAGWLPLEIEGVTTPELDQYEGEHEEDKQYFLEAQESGFSIVFLLYPEGEERS